MRKIFFVLGLLTSLLVQAQPDFNIQVRVTDNQIEITDRTIFRRLENDIKTFIANQKWSIDKVLPTELFDLTIEIIPSTYNQTTGEITAVAMIQCRRPVFGTNYNSILLNFRDENFNFTYLDQQRFDYNEGQYSSEITGLVAFYCNYTLGLDYDSFGQEGGTPYFNKAAQILSLAQAKNGAAGWTAFGKNLRTRYNLIDNILNERFKSIRLAYYLYHRKGMDVFQKKPLEARKQIFKAIEEIKKVYSIAPNTVMLLMFFDAKRDEIINIYKGATAIEKPKMLELLSEIDITNATKYEAITQAK
jgi:hypothetical protein